LNKKKELISMADDLSIVRQCKLIGFTRSTYYYEAVPDFYPEELKIMEEIDKIYTEMPFYGYRKMYWELKNLGYNVGRDRTLKYMQHMGIEAIYPKRNKHTTVRDKEHLVYPYLLKGMEITTPNQVWATDITYLPLTNGFCYLVAIIDWYSKKILSWKLSLTLDRRFCIEALKEAIERHGKPEIFNTDQGCQFTSTDFIQVLVDNGIKISMDSKGRALDNIVIERFWRTLKYEDIYIKKYQTIKEVKAGLQAYMVLYNTKRRHETLEYKTPDHVHRHAA